MQWRERAGNPAAVAARPWWGRSTRVLTDPELEVRRARRRHVHFHRLRARCSSATYHVCTNTCARNRRLQCAWGHTYPWYLRVCFLALLIRVGKERTRSGQVWYKPRSLPRGGIVAPVDVGVDLPWVDDDLSYLLPAPYAVRELRSQVPHFDR